MDLNVNIDEKEGKTPEYDARYMHKKDVLDMIGGLRSASSLTAGLIWQIARGQKFNETQEALNRLVNELRSGEQKDFARKNKWLKTKQGEFLNEASNDQTPEDKRAVADLYNIVTGTAELTDEICRFLVQFNGETMLKVYRTCLFFLKITEAYPESYMEKLNVAFADFANIFDKFNNASIYKELEVSKTEHTFEENYEIVLDYMDDVLVHSVAIGEFLINVNQTSPGQMNKLYMLDRDTREFSGKAADESLINNAYAEAEALLAKIDAVSSEYAGDIAEAFFSAVRKPVDGILNTALSPAKEQFENIKNSPDKAPYCVFRYHPTVKDVASKYLFVSLPDPKSDGTRYNEIAKKMIQRIKELAKTVAKQAP